MIMKIAYWYPRIPPVLPGMEIFSQVRGIHASDGEFQFGFGDFLAPELKFQKKQIYGNGEFLRIFRILKQPTWQHCIPPSRPRIPPAMQGLIFPVRFLLLMCDFLP